MSVLFVVHLLCAIVWVGGMFFAYLVLRPASGALEREQRLLLWSASLGRFLAWIWAAAILLPLTGYWMVSYLGGMGAVGLNVNIMQGLGWIMILLFLHVFFAPYRRLRRAVASNDLDAAARQLGQIRLLVGINLALGLIVVIVAAGGRYF